MSESSAILTFRGRLRGLVADRFRRSDHALFIIQIVFILAGAFVGGVAQIMPATIEGATPWREVLGYGGPALVTFGGGLLWWLQRNATEELEAAFEAQNTLESKEGEFAAQLEKLSELFDQAETANDQRAQLAEAVARAISIVDEVIAADTKDLKSDVEKILTASLPGLQAGLGLATSDIYCISVFQRKRVRGQGERMVRFAERRRGAPEKPVADSRSWQRGSGFTGYTWQSGGRLMIDNSSKDHWRDLLQDVTEEDTKNYASVGCVLIRPGQDVGEPWGALTVTTNKLNCFGTDAKPLGAARSDAVDAMAKILAILIAARYAPAPEV
ncbi:MAG: hypothetical protein ACOVN5_05455 [Aquidulcibacter sp.]